MEQGHQECVQGFDSNHTMESECSKPGLDMYCQEIGLKGEANGAEASWKTVIQKREGLCR